MCGHDIFVEGILWLKWLLTSQLGLTSIQHKNLSLGTQIMGHCSLVDSLTRQRREAGFLNSLPLSTIMK